MRRFSKPFLLLALSAYRVMPAMARTNARLIAMRGQMHLLGAMENAASGEAAEAGEAPQLATEPDPARNAPIGIPVRIEIHNLTLAYHDGEPVVRDLTAAFEPGQIHTITGASGSGKSTLVSSSAWAARTVNRAPSFPEGQKLGAQLTSRRLVGLTLPTSAQQPFLFSGIGAGQPHVRGGGRNGGLFGWLMALN